MCCRQQRYKADPSGVQGILPFIRTIGAEAVSNLLKNSGERVGESPGRPRIVRLRGDFSRLRPPKVVPVMPNVRAEAEPTAKRQARAVENAPARRTGLVF